MGLVAKVGAGSASDAEVGRFQTLMQERAERILATPPEELFVARDVVAEPPPKPWISPPVHCAGCGEPVAAAHIRTLGERRLRIPCAQEADRAREAIRERLAMAARAVGAGPVRPGRRRAVPAPSRSIAGVEPTGWT